MGILNGVGQGIAKSFSGATTPADWSNESMNYGAASTLLSSGGQLLQGIGGAQAAGFSARIARQNAESALQAGQTNESILKGKYSQLASDQVAGFAGQGVGVSGGNVRDVVNATRSTGALDSALMHYNFMREAYGSKVQEAEYKAVGANAMTKGMFGAASSFLGGAASLAAKWSARQQMGV